MPPVRPESVSCDCFPQAMTSGIDLPKWAARMVAYSRESNERSASTRTCVALSAPHCECLADGLRSPFGPNQDHIDFTAMLLTQNKTFLHGRSIVGIQHHPFAVRYYAPVLQPSGCRDIRDLLNANGEIHILRR